MSELYLNDLVASSFSRASTTYDRYSRIQDLALKELIERVRLLKIQPKVVLDLGCGTGKLTRELKHLFPRAKVYGMDVSYGMVGYSKHQEPWFKRAHFINADAHSLPFDSQSIDLVVSNLMIHWCNDIDTVLKELARVLIGDAPLFFTTLGPATLHEIQSAWHDIDDAPHVHPFLDMHHLGDGLLKTGFRDPVMDRHDHTLYFNSVREAMDSLRLIGAQNQLTHRRKTLTSKSRFKCFESNYAKLAVQSGLPLSYELIFGHARAPGVINKSGPQEFRVAIEDIIRKK